MADDEIDHRFNEHCRILNNSESKPTTVAKHFLSAFNHSPNDMLLIPIEKVFSNRDSSWKVGEAFLIFKARTIDHDGYHNVREETYFNMP